jgi:hypothetical protein
MNVRTAALFLIPLLSHAASLPSTPLGANFPALLADAEPKTDLKKFLYSTQGTYGWQPVKGTIMYDFFKDGRLAVQGPDGEATMWEGKWSLKDNQLTISYDQKTVTVTAAIDGNDLLLDGKRYRRYKPE